ncbi:MAG: methyltransferase [bacterium]|nr:methyltransferase [bacterium]
MNELSYNGKTISLRRFPLRDKEPLRPWDAADDFLLKNISEDPVAEGSRVLLVNDSFGALAVALNHLNPIYWSDSHYSREGLVHNLEANGLSAESVPFVPASDTPEGPFDVVLMKLPKSMAFWEDSLLRLRPVLAPGARIISGGMIKHTPKRAYELLESILGPTKTSLGWKKSRLAFSSFDASLSPPDTLENVVYELEDFGLSLSNSANVFSRDHLDLGTRFLLPHLPKTEAALQVLDVGSGNGVLALAVAKNCKNAQVLGLDESYQAVACARENADSHDGLSSRVSFDVSSGLQDLQASAYDLVVCNPPFHQAQAVGDQIAWGMFHQSRRILKPGGRLLIVGNQHLGYHIKLERLFGNCTVVASNKKFVVLQARMSGSDESF